jgi:hypothetical protein
MSTLYKWICLLTLLGLAACAPAAATPATAPGATEAPQANPTSAVSATSAAEAELIRYHVSGGIAGLDDTWVIYTSGRVQHTGRSPSGVEKLSASHLTALTAAVRSPEVAALKESYVPTNTCCDRFLYEITLTRDGQTQTLRTLDAAPDEPPALTNLRIAIEAALR